MRLAFTLGAFALSATFLSAQTLVTNPNPRPIPLSGVTVTLDEIIGIPSSSNGSPATRINHLKVIPDGSGRHAVNDLNGPFWFMLLDGTLREYLDFRDEDLSLQTSPGLGTGFTSFAFHPEFADNGLFYTAHMANSRSGTADFPLLVNRNHSLQGVIMEWQATDPAANTFAGTRRELLRVDLIHTIHGLQEIAFNPLAVPGDADYGLLFILLGEAGSYIQGARDNTHRLDGIMGTILRIDPAGDNAANGQYGYPLTNPWADDGDPETLGEIWAYGFRNPHRISWDPAIPGAAMVGDIGERNIEELNLVRGGEDFGWPQREGPFLFDSRDSGDRNEVFTLPSNDAEFGYTYPAIWYDHDEGDAIVSGFVYRGSLMPELYGHFIFGDIRQGYMWHLPVEEVAAGNLDAVQEMSFVINGQSTTLADFIPGNRADIRFGLDANDEFMLLTKPDGKIYRMTQEGVEIPLFPGPLGSKSTWMGFVNDSRAPWVLSTDLGWLNMVVEGQARWAYSITPGLGWLYLHPDFYPYLYRFDDGHWLYYAFPGEGDLAWFYDLTVGEWVVLELATR